VVNASVIENRRARRWKVFFQFVAIFYVILIAALMMPDQIDTLWNIANPHVSLVKVEGIIDTDAKASADSIIKGLRSAFEDSKTKGIILRINSPGGSPVQAGYVYDEIIRLRGKYKNIPVYAVIVDVGASAAYYIASAADAIYADKASLVGSIGVLMNGFGFVKTLENLGMERRLLTSGERKGILDPFSPLTERDRVFVKDLLAKMHEQFINAVKQGRKGKLQDDPNIFSGLFWNGQEAVALGLIDGLGSSSYVARDIIGIEQVVDHTHKEDWLERFSEQMGSRLTNALLTVTMPKLQ
jgi:protease-4